MVYKNTQTGNVIIYSLGITAAIILAVGVFYPHFVIYLTAGLLTLGTILFYKLTVIVDKDDIKLLFGIGLIQKKFLFKDIDSCKSVRNSWYHGWGIHLTPDGWVFNVSGFDAVEIIMKNGRRYRIGTNDSEGLIKAIQSSLKEDKKLTSAKK